MQSPISPGQGCSNPISTADIWGPVICWGGVPGLDPLDASIPHPVKTTKNAFRQCLTSPEGQNYPQLRTTALRPGTPPPKTSECTTLPSAPNRTGDFYFFYFYLFSSYHNHVQISSSLSDQKLPEYRPIGPQLYIRADRSEPTSRGHGKAPQVCRDSPQDKAWTGPRYREAGTKGGWPSIKVTLPCDQRGREETDCLGAAFSFLYQS